MNLVSTKWLNSNLNKVKIFDASWHMPNSKRSAEEEYLEKHIPKAIFWDVDKHSDKDSSYPHMMPNSDYWTRMLWRFEIRNDDHIIVYDNSDIYSSCRLWFSLKYFGHEKVSVLDGGFQKWLKEKKPTTKKIEKVEQIDSYQTNENIDLIKNKKQIDENIIKKEFIVIDARSRGRFEGSEPEPRKELKSGSIPNSICLPFKECINEDHSFKNKEQLLLKFKEVLGSEKLPVNLVFTCGSGITAAVLSLAYSIINDKYLPTIYDGSWAEYGKLK
jgi:thiosulfate/3-mercaptopyruvate sulfurtransferase